MGWPVLNWRKRRKLVHRAAANLVGQFAREKGRGPSPGTPISGEPARKNQSPHLLEALSGLRQSIVSVQTVSPSSTALCALSALSTTGPGPTQTSPTRDRHPAPDVAPYNLQLVRPGLPSRNLHPLTFSQSPLPGSPTLFPLCFWCCWNLSMLGGYSAMHPRRSCPKLLPIFNASCTLDAAHPLCPQPDDCRGNLLVLALAPTAACAAPALRDSSQTQPGQALCRGPAAGCEGADMRQ